MILSATLRDLCASAVKFFPIIPCHSLTSKSLSLWADLVLNARSRWLPETLF